MQPKYKSLIVRILIAIGIDIVLLSVFIIWMQANPDVYYSTIEILLLMAIFVINIGLAVAAKYVMNRLYVPLILNSVLSVSIFHLLFIAWYAYKDKDITRWQFAVRGKHYELTLNKKDTSYTFSEKFNDRVLTKIMGGEYKISNDSLYLIDAVNQMIVFRDSLIGFDKGKIALNNE